MIVKASESGIANQIPDTPKNFGNKIKLGISQLPQQEIRDSLLIAGTDQQIRIRYPSGIQIIFQHIRRDGFR